MSRSTLTQPELSLQSSVPWRPRAYAKRALRFAIEHAAAALFLEPGLGKTSIAYAYVKWLKARGLVDKVLVIAPRRVCHLVWPREREKWTDFEDLRVVVLHGDRKDELLLEDADVYVVNPEGLPWLLGMTKERGATGRVRVAVDLKRWRRLGFDALIVDELSKFKDPSAQRSKALKQVVPTFGRRLGMTGSPNPNGLMDLFGQCLVLDEGRSLGKYVTHYRMKYFEPAWNGYDWTIREGAEREIWKRLRPLAITMRAADYLDLPKLVEERVEVELPADARAVYDALEEDLVARIADRTVVAANAAAASTKCRQVANGGVYLDPEVRELVKVPKGAREHVDLHQEKTAAVVDLVSELQGSPLLVAYDFAHDLGRLLAGLGAGTPHIGGGTSDRRAAAIERAWNAGELPVLLAHPQSVGHGLNLQGASACHVCWHSLTWNLELYEQFIRRVLRQGNKAKRVFVHHVVAKGTVDEAMLEALRSKRKGQAALFDALKAHVASRHRGDMRKSTRKTRR